MIWNEQQERARSDVASWYHRYQRDPRSSPQVYRLFGFAGTGKTTLADTIDEDLTGRQAQFLTPTAKAASVLRSKGALNADTAHSQIYTPKDKSRQKLRDLEALVAKAEADLNRHRSATLPNKASIGVLEAGIVKLRFSIKEEQTKLSRPSWAVNMEAPIKDRPLIVLDEASMFGQQLGEDILSYGIPVLVIGDPAQLPPVGGGGFFTNQKPETMLTDIRRQALDNPIIFLATQVREGGSLTVGSYGSSRVIPRSSLTPRTVTEADQLLVGRNVTRRSCNLRFREIAGYPTAFPLLGERLVCLRNNRETGIYNGVTYIVTEDSVDHSDAVTLWLEEEASSASFVVEAHRGPFLNEDIPWYDKKDHEEFDYGYALTVHKFQGSQAKRVCLFDEWTRADSRRQWLYTGITRASEELTVVQF